MSRFTESVVEDAALGWLESLGYAVLHGPDISPDGDSFPRRERAKYSDVVLEGRIRQALIQLNPDLPVEALEDAYRKLRTINQLRTGNGYLMRQIKKSA